MGRLEAKQVPDKKDIDAASIHKEKGGWLLYEPASIDGNNVSYQQEGRSTGTISKHFARANSPQKPKKTRRINIDVSQYKKSRVKAMENRFASDT